MEMGADWLAETTSSGGHGGGPDRLPDGEGPGLPPDPLPGLDQGPNGWCRYPPGAWLRFRATLRRMGAGARAWWRGLRRRTSAPEPPYREDNMSFLTIAGFSWCIGEWHCI